MGRVGKKGRRTGFKFKLAAEDVHEQFHDRVHRRQGVGEQNEANDDGVFAVEAKRGVEGAVVDEDGEEGEDVEDVELEIKWVSKPTKLICR